LAVLAAGCGGDDKGGGAASDEGCGCYADDGCGCGCGCGCAEEEDSSGGGDYTPDKATATIKGTVKWDGKPPRRPQIDMGTEKYCTEHHTEPLRSEQTIVGPDGGLANTVVYVTEGTRGWKFPKGEGSAELDQVGCMYKPYMTAIQTGDTLVVKNNDPIMHNVHAVDMRTTRDAFNIAQSQKGAESKQSRLKPGKYSVKCDVHGWMQSYVCVFKNPFFAVTGEDGAFELKLPPGTYTVEAWHPKWGTKTAKVTVADGGSGEAAFTFSK
jgi:plastocyanin